MVKPMTQDQKISAASNLEQLELSLENALKAGGTALPQQIRYILAFSQLHAGKVETYRDRTLNMGQARFAALVECAAGLTPAQVERLYTDLRSVTDFDIRLSLQARLLPYLNPAVQYARSRELWSQLEHVTDAVVTIRVMMQIADLPTPAVEVNSEANPLVQIMMLAGKLRNAEARIRSLVALADHAPPNLAGLLYKNILAVVNRVPNDALRSTTIMALTRHAPAEFENQIIEAARSINRPVHRARALIAVAQAFPERVDLKNDALSVISRIDNEDDKAEMLVNLAAYLQRVEVDEIEYPETLRRALSISLDVNKRSLRAKVLVALSPLMTRDLQVETLAAVNGLPSERERASLLAELVHALPSDVLVASLAVAHNLREQDARVHALSVLAHYVPEHARAQTIFDAYAAALNLTSPYERVTAVLALVDILNDGMKAQAFTSALEIIRLIENENARSRALSQIGHHLPEGLVARALELALEIQNPEMRLSALSGVASRLDENVRSELALQMLDAAEQIELSYKRARALGTIAPHVAPKHSERARTLIDQLDEPLDRFNASIALIQSTPPELRAELAMKTWDILSMIEEGYDRAGALVSIAPYLPPDYTEKLQQAALNVVSTIDDDYDKASAITLLASVFGDNPFGEHASPMPDAHTLTVQAIKAAVSIPYQNARVALLKEGIGLWLKLNETQRYALWKDIARRLKSLPLADVLLSLGVLLPVFEAISGEGTVQRITSILGLNSMESKTHE